MGIVTTDEGGGWMSDTEKTKPTLEEAVQTALDEPKPKILVWSAMGKRIIAAVLIVMMFVLVVLVTIEIVFAVIQTVVPGLAYHPESLMLDEAGLLKVLGLFLSVLIAMELIETVEVYFRKHAIHVEIVVLVAIIALARKVIILDLNKYPPLVLFSLGFLVIALGGTYWFVRSAAPRDE
jgi:uncharacterized membrane protein (DUF373 family)